MKRKETFPRFAKLKSAIRDGPVLHLPNCENESKNNYLIFFFFIIESFIEFIVVKLLKNKIFNQNNYEKKLKLNKSNKTGCYDKIRFATPQLNH